MDYTVHGILQAKILEWVAIPFCRGSSQPRYKAQLSCIPGGFFISWDTSGQLSIISQDKISLKYQLRNEIKRCLLFGRKAMTNLDSILKSRDITLPTKVHLVKAIVFLVVMYGCESWTIKKAEHWRTDALELWCWRRLLRVPWTARRSNQSIQMKSVLNVHWKDWCWNWNSSTLAT